MFSQISKFTTILLLILALSSLSVFQNVAYADQNPDPESPGESDSDAPTAIILSVVGGIVLVGLGYYLYKQSKDSDSQVEATIEQQEMVREENGKVTIGLSSFEDSNIASQNKNGADFVQSIFEEILDTHETLEVEKNVTVSDLDKQKRRVISHVIMGEVNIFEKIYEIEIRVVDSKEGKTTFSKKILCETEKEIRQKSEGIIDEIYNKISEE